MLCVGVDTGSTATVVTSDSAVITMFTLVWQWSCAHHCESSGKLTALSHHCQIQSLSHLCAHHYLSTVTTTAAPVLSLSMLLHCKQHNHCHNAVLLFAATALCSVLLSQHCAHLCQTTVGFLLCSGGQSGGCRLRSWLLQKKIFV